MQEAHLNGHTASAPGCLYGLCVRSACQRSGMGVQQVNGCDEEACSQSLACPEKENITRGGATIAPGSTATSISISGAAPNGSSAAGTAGAAAAAPGSGATSGALTSSACMQKLVTDQQLLLQQKALLAGSAACSKAWVSPWRTCGYARRGCALSRSAFTSSAFSSIQSYLMHTAKDMSCHCIHKGEWSGHACPCPSISTRLMCLHESYMHQKLAVHKTHRQLFVGVCGMLTCMQQMRVGTKQSHRSAKGGPVAWTRLGGSSGRRNNGGHHFCVSGLHSWRHRRGQWQRQPYAWVRHCGRRCQDRFLPTQQELSGASLHSSCMHRYL